MLALIVGVGACTPSETDALSARPSSSPTAGPCAAIVDEQVADINLMMDELEEAAKFGPSESYSPPPDLLDAFNLEEIERREEEARCSKEVMRRLMRQKADEIRGEGPFPELWRQLFRGCKADATTLKVRCPRGATATDT